MASNKLEKVSHILNHNHEKNLSKLYANSYGSNEYFAICGSGNESEGEIMIMSQKSKKLAFDLKINGNCTAVSFTPDERSLFAVSDQAEIYHFDLVKRACISKFNDEGSFKTTHV